MGQQSESSLPRMLGRYALYEKIASGGMASVHIGRLLGPVGFARTVAIKRMHPQFASDPEFVSMFLDEARLAARIRHPNVVPTLDVVAMAEELFLVMDFVQGESLSHLIRGASHRKERIPSEMTAAILAGALHGLHAAHEAKSDGGTPLGIVHRDVSPHNILVGTDGVARVLDFGVAKAVGRLQTTRDGQLKGKLGYMAPEQVRGTVTRATDVYAAAVVLWEALTSKRLFRAENEAQLLDMVLRGCDVPPSKHAPGLPEALDAVTMRGLDVDPTKRFATAREMARALEDAIPLAATSRIGDWVESVAKDTLDERSARIASIESDSSLQLPAATAAAVAVEAPVAGPVSLEDAGPTQLSSASVSSPHAAPSTRKGRRLSWIAVGVGAVVGAALIAAMVSSPSFGPQAVAGGHPPIPVPSVLASTRAAPETPSAAASSPPPVPPPEPSPSTAGGAASEEHPAPLVPRFPPARTTSPASRPASPASATTKPVYNPLEHL